MSYINNEQMGLYKKVNRFFSNIYDMIHYNLATRQNKYRCILVSEIQNVQDQYNTVITYRILGKRNLFEITIRELLEQHALINQFSPIDAMKLGEIAMGDFIFSEFEMSGREEAQKKFNLLKNKMLENTRG